MINHTPGPWMLDEETSNGIGGPVTIRTLCRRNEYGNLVAIPLNTGGTTDGKANAMLCAAAPELLEACQRAEALVGVARNYFPKSVSHSHRFDLEIACAALNKAIAKAQGK